MTAARAKTRAGRLLPACVLAAGAALFAATWLGLHPAPAALGDPEGALKRVQVLDRRGTPLSVTYENEWNVHDRVAFAEIPEFLRAAFIAAEDKRFFEHSGVDWRARAVAVAQNLGALRVLRGASTISEQVVRILHPRPRSLWSRWLESFEAGALEGRFNKSQILELYLNQVPFSRRRRGIVQAARLYFDRDLATLSKHEMLALAVLVRAPGRLDPLPGIDPSDTRQRASARAERLQRAIVRLATLMSENGQLDGAELSEIREQRLATAGSELSIEAAHFVRHVSAPEIPGRLIAQGKLRSTLDGALQNQVSQLLKSRIKDLSSRNVSAGAALVIDHSNDEVLVWSGVSGGDTSAIDPVLAPRQPGSTLKPFLYALALERGWSAATILEDSPLSQPVGSGMHDFRNYSRVFYGPLRLREALGNSLNIPAVRTIDFTGKPEFLELLRNLGFTSLSQQADFYGEGLALGNGEVTLLELVRAYATLARGGVQRPLRTALHAPLSESSRRRIVSEESASLVSDILSDPSARRLEFGSGGVMRFPLQTAVKTGTSSDYHDAWAVAFNHRYTAGIWLGNLDRQPMREISGAAGPALALRSIFAELGKREEGRGLYLSPKLVSRKICSRSGELAGPACPAMREWFDPRHQPKTVCSLHYEIQPSDVSVTPIRIVLPTPGLQMAKDPRIPDNLEAFPFSLKRDERIRRTEWLLNGEVIATTGRGVWSYPWRLERGRFVLKARAWREGETDPTESQEIGFWVK